MEHLCPFVLGTLLSGDPFGWGPFCFGNPFVLGTLLFWGPFCARDILALVKTENPFGGVPFVGTLLLGTLNAFTNFDIDGQAEKQNL